MPQSDSRNLHEEIAALTCPKIALSFKQDIAHMFTKQDVAHMKAGTGGRLDLSQYQDVKIFAAQIYKRVSAQDSSQMPPAGSGEKPWTPDMIQTFGCWMQQGCKP